MATADKTHDRVSKGRKDPELRKKLLELIEMREETKRIVLALNSKTITHVI